MDSLLNTWGQVDFTVWSGPNIPRLWPFDFKVRGIRAIIPKSEGNVRDITGYFFKLVCDPNLIYFLGVYNEQIWLVQAEIKI